MKIFNLHGYKGEAHNAAWGAWNALGCEVVSPKFDYDMGNPAERVQSAFESLNADLICGTSLGGFYAAMLAAKCDKPLVLVNPCLMSFYWLPKLGYKGNIINFIKPFVTFTDIFPNRVFVIVGGKDEVITSHKIDKRLFGDERVKVISDGMHSGATLPLEEFFADVLKEI